MIACAGCAIWNPISIAAAGILGGGIAFLCIIEPSGIHRRITSPWGLPAIRASDIVSIPLVMAGPALIAMHGRDDHGIQRIAVVLSALLVCCLYLWFRGLWLLQQFSVTSRVKRFVLNGLVIPGTILFAIIIGHWIFSAIIVASMGGIGDLLLMSFLYIFLGGLALFGARAGLAFVLDEPPDELETNSFRESSVDSDAPPT